MSYKPKGGDKILFHGIWYDPNGVLTFLNKCRSSDITVRAVRVQLLSDLNSLKLPKFSETEQVSRISSYLSEYQGDWLIKFTAIRNFLTTRGTNKGNTKLKGVTSEQDDRDLSDDEVYSFWTNTSTMIRELLADDYIYTPEEFDIRFYWTTA